VSGQIAKGAFISSVIGGTTSVISGGKFANGAKTGAFQYLFNQAVSLSSLAKLSRVIDAIDTEISRDMADFKSLLTDATMSDEVIDFLEQRGYLDDGAWKGYRGIDMTSHGNRAFGFRVRYQVAFDNMRRNYIGKSFKDVRTEMGDILVSQYDFKILVKSSIFSLAPTQFEQRLYGFADDAISAYGILKND
jgi:hypothetical protein